jgi:hypothetical protein
MRRLVFRLSDSLLKPLALVESLSLLLTAVLTVTGVWWLASPELFAALAMISLGLMLIGLINFWLLHIVVGNRFDMNRCDLTKK